ncbi:ABC transporter ATP-binding protein [uncultured Corynebacterium sp.]|uniref:ABC transporter ATP-binding protein n=1 Tax=uncultured Corynebacterium sp. TaxID=159447 RepID=UPI00288930B4|nr:ABC transporter ATP-binding protein [uncultured Corynebacterium sp.]
MQDSSAPQLQPLLQVTGAVKKFGAHTAVDGLDFQVYPGEIVALLGPNGAGKTTTIEMCEGFARPDAGEIRLFGLDPAKESDAVRSRIGVMLQGGGAYPGIRVGEMLKLVASYSEDPLDTEWLLDMVGLTKHRSTTYRRLSGGQQQRLALACALVNRPELVFLDEPTAGLDAQSRHAVWDIVRSMRRDGVGVVLTTHLLDEAEALSDRVVIIDKGKVVAAGTPKELTSERSGGGSGHTFQVSVDADLDRGHFHRALLEVKAGAAKAEQGALLDEASGAVSAPTVRVREIKPRQFAVEGIPATPDGVLMLALAARDCATMITKLDSTEQTLEEVFLSLTGWEMRS